MRILAFSDIHRNRDLARAILEASDEADAVVGAGDFATRGVGLNDTMDFLRNLDVPTVFVAGNHDNLEELRAACRTNDAIHVLHGDGTKIHGVPFFGLGYEIPAGLREPWNQRLEETEAVGFLNDCPTGAVLVTHSPPFGVADVQTTGAHEGSDAIRRVVASGQLLMHLCGHIHNGWGMSGTIGRCPVYNLGPSLNWLTL